MTNKKILITGANGQIGSVLAAALRSEYGDFNVLTTDIRPPKEQIGAFELLDVQDKPALIKLVEQHKINIVYHLAAILSARGEQNPQLAWDVNMGGLFNVLSVAATFQLQVFFPSSIAVFGDYVQKENTPQFSNKEPQTVYGMSKLSGELWCQYYHQKYQVDVRSLRYPGIIGYQSLPGGGTTDYAVDIFHHAVQGKHYACFLKEDTRLPMIYMDDAISATIRLMQIPESSISVRTSYNLAGHSFAPGELAHAIQHHFPDFKVSYEPDFRQGIADTWPSSIDDSQARQDWGWQPVFDLKAMTNIMIEKLKLQYLVDQP